MFACGSSSSPQSQTNSQSNPGPGSPTTPAGLVANALSMFEIDLIWNASTDDIGVAGYKISRNGAYLLNTTSTSYVNNGLTPGSAYCYNVSAYDADGNFSSQSITACANTVADTTPPWMQSFDFVVTPFAHNGIDIAWLEATDNVGIRAYLVYRDEAYLSSTISNSFTDANIMPAGYCYNVIAVDAAGNTSNSSPIGCAKTPGFIDISGEYYNDSSSVVSVTSDGPNFWVANYASGAGPKIIYEYDRNSAGSFANIPAPSNSTSSLLWESNEIWLTDYEGEMKFFRISAGNGSVINSVPIDYFTYYLGSAYDGEYAYLASYNGITSNSRIARTDITNGATEEVIYSFVGSIDGLAFVNGTLWFVEQSFVMGTPSRLVNISTAGSAISSVSFPSYELNGANTGGLTVSNGEFWYLRRTQKRGIVRFYP